MPSSKLPVTPYPSPDPNSPNVPVWTPSQFKGAGSRRNMPEELEEYSLGETIANAVSTGVAAALAIAGLVILIVLAVLHGGGARVLAALAFSIPMVLAFLMSTLYHALPYETAKQVFRVIGHDFVFLYIAGAFTPYCTLVLADTGGMVLCSIEWVLAFAGILIESIWFSRPKWVPYAICIVMCCAALPFAGAFAAALDPIGLWLLCAALICFFVGIVLYVFRKMPYFWFVSHLAVLAGSVCLFLSVALFVI